MKKENMLIIFAIIAIFSLLWGLSEHQKQIDLQSKIISLEAQKTSYEDYLAFNRTYINLNGNGGMFSPDRNMLYVKTSYGSNWSCLIFLHELGHSIQYVNGDNCFYSKDLNACEKQADVFREQNAWRCVGFYES